MIVRETTIGPCRLIQGDCLEVLPLLSKVDAVVTDPPYGMNVNTDNSRFSGGTKGNIVKRGNGPGTGGGKPIIGDNKPFDPSFLTGFGKRQIIWGWNHFPDKLPKGACLIWIKRTDDAFGSFLSDAETAWFSHGCGVYCRRDLSNNAVAKERIHPTQKPLSLMEWCLSFVRDAQIILDPFMGSATTAVACIRHEKTFVGIEKDESHFANAVKRVEAAWQLKCSELPFDEPTKMKQTSIFDAR